MYPNPKDVKKCNESGGNNTCDIHSVVNSFEFRTLKDIHNFNFISVNKTDFFISLVTFMLDKKEKKSLFSESQTLYLTPAVR